MPRYEVTIEDWQPATVNELMASVKQRIRLKRRDRDFVNLYVKVRGGVPAATGKRKVGLRLTMAAGQRRCDVDAYWKSLLDALKFCGLIVDDGPLWLEITPVEFDPVRLDGHFLTTITLEDV